MYWHLLPLPFTLPSAFSSHYPLYPLILFPNSHVDRLFYVLLLYTYNNNYILYTYNNNYMHNYIEMELAESVFIVAHKLFQH